MKTKRGGGGGILEQVSHSSKTPSTCQILTTSSSCKCPGVDRHMVFTKTLHDPMYLFTLRTLEMQSTKAKQEV